MRSLIAMATAFVFAVACAQAAQAGGWAEVVKAVVRGVAKGVGRKTTRTIVVVAERRTAVSAQAAKISSIRSTVIVSTAGAKIGDAVFSLRNIVIFMSLLGVESSGSKEADELFHKDVAAGAAAKEKNYVVLVCRSPEGRLYGVPSDAIACLHGGVPESLDQSVDLTTPKLTE